MRCPLCDRPAMSNELEATEQLGGSVIVEQTVTCRTCGDLRRKSPEVALGPWLRREWVPLDRAIADSDSREAVA